MCQRLSIFGELVMNQINILGESKLKMKCTKAEEEEGEGREELLSLCLLLATFTIADII